MATKIGGVELGLGLDSEAFKKGLKEAKNSLDGIVTAMKGLGDIAKDVSQAIEDGINKVASAYAVQASAEEAALRTFGNSAREIMSLASDLQGITLFGDEVTINAAVLAKNMGLVKDQIVEAMPALQDFAAASGRDLTDAVKQFSDAIASKSLEPLKEFGLVFGDATKAAFQLASQSTRTAFLIEALEGRFKGAAQAARKTGVGAMKAYENALGDLDEQIGSFIDKPLAATYNSMEDAIVGVTDALSGLSPEFKDVLGTIGMVAASVVSAVAGLAALGATVKVVAVSWPVLAGSFAAGSVAVKTLAGSFTLLLKAMAPILIKIAIIAAAIAGLVFVVGLLKRAWDADFLGIQTITNKVFDGIGEAFEDLKKKVKEFTGVISEVFEKAKKVWMDIDDAIRSGIGMESNEEEQERRARTGEGDQPTEIAKNAAAAVADEVEKTFGAAGEVFKPLTDGIKGAVDKLKEYVLASGESTEQEKKKIKTLKDAVAEMLAEAEAKQRLAEAREAAEQAYTRRMNAHLADVKAYQDKLKGKQEEDLKNADKHVSELERVRSFIVGKTAELGGEITSLISAGMEGFASGGPIGAIFAVIVEMLKKMASVKKAIDLMGEGIQMVADAFSPLFDGLAEAHEMANDSLGKMLKGIEEPIENLSKVFDTFFNAMGPITDATNRVIGIIVKMFGPALEILGQAFEGIAWVFEKVFEGLDIALTEIEKAFDSFMREVRNFLRGLGFKFGMNADQINAHMQQLNNSVKRQAEVAKAWTFSAEQTGGSLQELGRTADRVSESLSNIPTGYKLIATMLESIRDVNPALVPSAGAPIGAAPAPVSTGDEALDALLQESAGMQGTQVTIGAVNVTANEPDEFLDAMLAEARFENYLEKGSGEVSSNSPGNM